MRQIGQGEEEKGFTANINDNIYNHSKPHLPQLNNS